MQGAAPPRRGRVATKSKFGWGEGKRRARGPPPRLYPRLPHPPGPFPFSCRLLPEPLLPASPHSLFSASFSPSPPSAPLSPRWGRKEEAQRTHLSFSSPQLFTTQGSSGPQGAAILALPPPPPPIHRALLPSNPSAAQTSPTPPPHSSPRPTLRRSLTAPLSLFPPQGPFLPWGSRGGVTAAAPTRSPAAEVSGRGSDAAAKRSRDSGGGAASSPGRWARHGGRGGAGPGGGRR